MINIPALDNLSDAQKAVLYDAEKAITHNQTLITDESDLADDNVTGLAIASINNLFKLVDDLDTIITTHKHTVDELRDEVKNLNASIDEECRRIH